MELTVSPKDLKKDEFKDDDNSMKGYFTIAVRSSQTNIVNIYWNNKTDLDFIELTPGTPNSINTSIAKKLYFSFYVGESDEVVKTDGKIRLYMRADSKADIYLLRNMDGELDAPGSSSNSWKSSIGHKGGIL